MTVPLPPEIILPTGQPAYLNPYRGTYTTSRSYALRMQRNYSRGVSQATARGHAPSPTGVSEYGIRAERFRQRWGFSLSFWRRMRRKYINAIEEMGQVPDENWPSGRDWLEIISADYFQVRQWYGIGPVPGIVIPPENIIEERLVNKLNAMIAYRQHDRNPGRTDFYARDNIRPIELWWYH